jgi:GGDEF domain-containing protein
MRWFTLYLPPAMLLTACAAVNFLPTDPSWSGNAVIAVIPYLVTITIIALGIFFNMSRLAAISLLMSMAYSYLSYLGLHDVIHHKAIAASFYTSLYLPVTVAILHRMDEAGIFNQRGAIKLAVVMIAVLGIIIFSSLPASVRWISQSSSVWVNPPVNWMPFPGLALVLLTCSAPFILIRNKTESPLMGIITTEALIVFLIGANSSHLAWNSHNKSAFMLLSGTGMLCLLIGCFENMWRHANIDELTDLPGRRSLKYQLARLSEEYTIALIDIDHFKKVNDTYGHKCGDDALRFIASILRSSGLGKVYRYGGEEFIIVMDGVKLKAGYGSIEYLREAICRRPFQIRAAIRPVFGRRKRKEAGAQDATTINMSVSIGIAKNRSASDDPNDVIAAADKALYRSKQDGRNRTTMASWHTDF